MAKSKSFFGLRRGSTKTLTFQVNNGQQITKDRVSEVRNPRSDGQMTQRSTFLSAVRFYQRANQRFFKFAFESKAQTESDYNAFMRLNAKVGGYITKAQGDAVGYPMIAPFTVTQGSLPAPRYGVNIELIDNDEDVQLIACTNGADVDVPTTVGGLSELILAEYPSYRAGDIVTLVTLYSTETGEFWSDLDYTQSEASGESVQWNIYQFILDTTDEGAVSALGLTVVKSEGGKIVLQRNVAPTQALVGGFVVVSRNTNSGLLVSTTTVKLSQLAMTAYDAMRTNAHRELVLSWWGAQQQAILQGAIANAQEVPVAPKQVSMASFASEATVSSRAVASNFDMPLMDRYIESVKVHVTVGESEQDYTMAWDSDEHAVRVTGSGILTDCEYMEALGGGSVGIQFSTGSGIEDIINVQVTEINRDGVVIFP